MRWMWLVLVLVLVACRADEPASTDTVSTAIDDAQSAVVHLNINSRTATISPISPLSDLLFSANVGDVDTVSYVVDTSEQTFILMTDASETPTTDEWLIETNPTIPTSYVVDVFGGDLTVDLSQSDVPRFDILAIGTMIDLTLPASSSQLAIDASDTTTNLSVLSGADIPSAQLVNVGGVMTTTVVSGAIFGGTVSVTSGGFVLNIPSTMGVQIIVTSSGNSEISLPSSTRIPAEVAIYETANFAEATEQITLTTALENASIRINHQEQ